MMNGIVPIVRMSWAWSPYRIKQSNNCLHNRKEELPLYNVWAYIKQAIAAIAIILCIIIIIIIAPSATGALAHVQTNNCVKPNFR